MNGNPKTFIDYFQKIYGLYQNVEYNWTKKMEDIEDLKDREGMGDKRYESWKKKNGSHKNS